MMAAMLTTPVLFKKSLRLWIIGVFSGLGAGITCNFPGVFALRKRVAGPARFQDPTLQAWTK